MPKVRDSMAENKPIYRFSIVTGSSLTMILSDQCKIDEGFLNISQEDFQYSVDKQKDHGKVVTTIFGDYKKYSTNMNCQNVMSWEKIDSSDDRYNELKDMIDRCIADKCKIAIPDHKEIVIAHS